jgi:magnesium-transporting ATPase (P-type)
VNKQTRSRAQRTVPVSDAALHHDYLTVTATMMSFAGITACQIGNAFASRTSHASPRDLGVLSNPRLIAGISIAVIFAVALIYLPPLQGIFHTAALGLPELGLLACFPPIGHRLSATVTQGTRPAALELRLL